MVTPLSEVNSVERGRDHLRRPRALIIGGARLPGQGITCRRSVESHLRRLATARRGGQASDRTWSTRSRRRWCTPLAIMRTGQDTRGGSPSATGCAAQVRQLRCACRRKQSRRASGHPGGDSPILGMQVPITPRAADANLRDAGVRDAAGRVARGREKDHPGKNRTILPRVSCAGTRQGRVKAG